MTDVQIEELPQVQPYTDTVQEPEELTLKTFEYCMPFNYRNVKVQRAYKGGEFHGVELFPIYAEQGRTTTGLPAEHIELTESHPIVRLAVIGSACTSPGWIQIECDPVKDFRRQDEIEQILPTRFRVDGLWGMHLRYDQWSAGDGKPLEINNPSQNHYPTTSPHPHMRLKAISREFPQAGMSCAVFEIPQSKCVRIMGGSTIPGWTDDNFPDDDHYSFRIVRTTVSVPAKGS